MSFYVTLLSNASKATFPSNHGGDFISKFPREININPNSHVALTELEIEQQVTESYLNNATLRIFDFEAFVEVQKPSETQENTAKETTKRWGKWAEESIDQSCFTNATDLAGCLNLLVYKHIARIREKNVKIFEYDSDTNRMWINLDQKHNVLLILQRSLLVLI